MNTWGKMIEMKSGEKGRRLESIWINKYLLHTLSGKGLEQNDLGGMVMNPARRWQSKRGGLQICK